VIYPPVNTTSGYIADRTDDYYLSAGRLVGTKRLEILIEACNKLRRKLLIVGAGRESERWRAMAGPTIEFTGRVSDAKLWDYYAHCRAFLFAAEEDFGIVPLEAQACGRPVIAYGCGGSLETVRVNDRHGLPDTGVFFDRQDPESVMDAILRFEMKEDSFSPRDIQKHARKFDKALFQSRMLEVIESHFPNSSKKRDRDVAVMSVAK
jgi:glycosyltransferase involved in cell wall biosynthesis